MQDQEMRYEDDVTGESDSQKVVDVLSNSIATALK